MIFHLLVHIGSVLQLFGVFLPNCEDPLIIAEVISTGRLSISFSERGRGTEKERETDLSMVKLGIIISNEIKQWAGTGLEKMYK